jgi:hypothetical protein
VFALKVRSRLGAAVTFCGAKVRVRKTDHQMKELTIGGIHSCDDFEKFVVEFLESGLFVDDQVHAIPGSCAGASAERTNGRHSMKDLTVCGVGNLIEETKPFGPKGFRKRLVL